MAHYTIFLGFFDPGPVLDSDLTMVTIWTCCDS